MRNLLFLIGLSLPLAGCLADRELPGREPFYRNADTAQSLGLLTPAVVKECSEHVARELPKIKIVGPFSISAPGAYMRADREHTLLPNNSGHDVVAVIAPSTAVNVFGGENNTKSGCLYRLRDNRLVFQRTDLFGDVALTKPDKP
jgi:hypothetical protein